MKNKRVVFIVALAMLPLLTTFTLCAVFLFAPEFYDTDTNTPMNQEISYEEMSNERISITQERNESTSGSLVILLICLSPVIAFNGIIAAFVLNDASKSELKTKYIWTVATFLGGIIVVVIYFVRVRKKG